MTTLCHWHTMYVIVNTSLYLSLMESLETIKAMIAYPYKWHRKNDTFLSSFYDRRWKTSKQIWSSQNRHQNKQNRLEVHNRRWYREANPSEFGAIQCLTRHKQYSRTIYSQTHVVRELQAGVTSARRGDQ